jgi:hypothetical protein
MSEDEVGIMGEGEPTEREEYARYHDEEEQLLHYYMVTDGEVEDARRTLVPVTNLGLPRVDFKSGRPKEEKWSYLIAFLIPLVFFIIVMVVALIR